MLDEFVLNMDNEKFRSTNGTWNSLMLNDPYSVGYVSQLIESNNWSSKEEWENFYYESGNLRNKLLGNNYQILNDFTIPLKQKNTIYSMPWNLKNLNYHYGRTKEDLILKARFLNQYFPNLSLNECFECVRFRIICETWNGIIIRETNTIQTLSKMFPNLSFRKTDGETDYRYAVDYEVYENNNKLKCGIQIKPKSYTYNTPYIQKARYMNQQKYNNYSQLKNVPVITIISKGNGELLNKESLSSLYL